MEICPINIRPPANPLRTTSWTRLFPAQVVAGKLHLRPLVFCGNRLQETGAVPPESPNRMFMLGMGYVGQFFAAELRNQGWTISGTCTSVSKRQQLQDMGYNAYVFDANDPKVEVLDILKHHTHLLISIPPHVDAGDPIFRHETLVKSSLENGSLRWLCYLSTTSVYGDSGNVWVDEESPIPPSTKLAEGRLLAEKEWLDLGFDLGLASHIFRLGGIYGPGRSAVDTIINQRPLSENRRKRLYKQYTSRVHVADICQALNAIIRKPSPGKIFNIIDDDPTPRVEVFKYAWQLVEKKWPGRAKSRTEFDTAKSFMATGKRRVSNARMKNELGIRLLYPSYKSGLVGIIEQMDKESLDTFPIKRVMGAGS